MRSLSAHEQSSDWEEEMLDIAELKQTLCHRQSLQLPVPVEKLLHNGLVYRPPLYEKPADEIVTKEEAREERWWAKHFPEIGPPVWRLAGWYPKPSEPSTPYKSAMKRPLEVNCSTRDKRSKTTTEIIEISSTNLPPSNITPLHHEIVPPPTPQPFIEDPVARVTQCVKLLCGNRGILTERSISKYIARRARTWWVRRVRRRREVMGAMNDGSRGDRLCGAMSGVWQERIRLAGGLLYSM